MKLKFHMQHDQTARLQNSRPRATRGVEIGGCFALVAGG